MSTNPTHAASGVAVAYRRRGLFALLLHTLVEWQERARRRRSLAHMDDRLLRDIGLTRSMIEAEASKPFWHP
ncbi:DUF1127 domain-containing protein [Rhodospirillaceae bacterium SYSU D60014]|uniref:DUF1127 domain-containing protein n=1 Tax=Virgifigura deserti TaxID=2268457 RepID=UPI000E66B477